MKLPFKVPASIRRRAEKYKLSKLTLWRRAYLSGFTPIPPPGYPAQKVKNLESRMVEPDGLVRVNGVTYQVPLELVGRVIRVDAENREYSLYVKRHVATYPPLRKTNAGTQG